VLEAQRLAQDRHQEKEITAGHDGLSTTGWRERDAAAADDDADNDSKDEMSPTHSDTS